ncbi:glycosyltransferase family 39 protein [Nocardia sp. NBC_01503]|uniref:ArnT family glycosyltransferase n=1 Tax=Nocardia sp. NBC_01503 TaxID=2975997 RepID=UPI002E7B0BDD|nr:glycosyltransferase family 39 protein [Nocardia sp. NBC_01503]WTL33207.1 glycosyltransferase family 39 protein [Nocardia sp. NBC_01503]
MTETANGPGGATGVMGGESPRQGGAAEQGSTPTAGRALTGRATRGECLALAVLLVGTAAAYLWNLTASGWANSFYAAAVQSGARSWKAFFFGSSDWADAITVDKTPASFWPMELSARVFGFSSASMLVPQVLIGVASVALLWALVRRYFGANAGLLAGLVLAVTPVAALMFRYNNPDALLVLLMIAAVWAMLRGLEDGRWRWLVLCGLFVGFGFLAKQLQVLLVLPALASAYLFAGPPKLGKRIAQLFAAGAAMVIGAGWWVLIAQLWPASDRPYFGGSEHNSIIELTLGYNGLDRLGSFGSSSGSGFGGGTPSGDLPSGGEQPEMHGGFGGFGGKSGITRLFNETVGGQIAWLIPAALILLVAAIVLCGRAPRTDMKRAALLVIGGWGLVTGLVFSFMSGIFHEYYTVALAPAIAGTIAAAAAVVWPHRDRRWVRAALVLSVALTALTAFVLLSRTPDFVPWLRWVIVGVAVLAAAGLLLRGSRNLTIAALLATLFVGLAAPTAYAVETLRQPHSGGIVKAGPKTNSGFPGFPGGGGTSDPESTGAEPNSAAPNGAAPEGAAPTGAAPNSAASDDAGQQRERGRSGGGPMGGDEKPSDKILALLERDGGAYTWVAATVSSNNAANYQLAADYPVMAIGGFSGGDPAPTLEQFQQDVAEGRIHFFIAGESRGPGGRSSSEGSKITTWVKDHYTAVQVDGVTLYDLTSPRTTG